ncbi:cytochrome P450 [Diaporthe sp. PMI_573]|nr:cytochrome P450 [Diaporthaceae sp. PMI_573]
MVFSLGNSGIMEDPSVANWLVFFGLLVISTTILFKPVDPYNRFPRVGLPWYLSWLPSTHVHELVDQGYRQFKGPFVLKWWALDWLVLGPQHLADLKHSKSTSLSFFQVISDALRLGHSVGDLYHYDKMAVVIKKGMNSQLPALTPIVVDEVNNAFESHVGSPEGWKEIKVADTISDLTNQVACRTLVCRELSRNSKFLKASMNFQQSIFIHAMIIIQIPFRPLRSIFTWLAALSHKRNLRLAMEVLEPVVAKRIEKRHYEDPSGDENDGIRWTLDLSKDEDMDPHRLSLEVVHNLFAGSLAPGALITEMIFQVLMSPALLNDLRQEAQQAISKHGWTEKLLHDLLLQDSFIRELSRVYPTGSTGCSRLVIDEKFTFSDGLTVPRGTRLTFPIMAIMKENDRLEKPAEFDAYRFLHLRDSSSDNEAVEYQWAASTSSPENLMFGYGKHACPGRYYCIRQAKLIFTKLIVDYDLEWLSPTAARPQREIMEGQFGPNRTQKMRLKKRKGMP